MRRRRLWIALALVAALTAAGITAALLLDRPATAEDQARAYLDALAAGDAEAAAATGIDAGETAGAALSAATGLISSPTVGAAVVDGRSATVAVTFELAGEIHETELALQHDGDRWVPTADSALATARLPVPVTIGEAFLDSGEPAPLYPGVYEAQAAPADYFEGSVELVLAPGDLEHPEVEAALRPEAQQLAQQQIDEYASACTETAAAAPERCGIVVPWAADLIDVTEISYEVERAPSIALDAESFIATGGALVATVRGTGFDGNAKTVSYRTDGWSMRGDVSFTADGVQLDVW